MLLLTLFMSRMKSFFWRSNAMLVELMMSKNAMLVYL